MHEVEIKQAVTLVCFLGPKSCVGSEKKHLLMILVFAAQDRIQVQAMIYAPLFQALTHFTFQSKLGHVTKNRSQYYNVSLALHMDKSTS